MDTVLVTTSSFGKNSQKSLDILKGKDLSIVINPFCRKLTEEELKGLLSEYRPVGLLAGTEPITESVLEGAKEFLKVISRVGVGWDNIDRESAQKVGILLYRTTGVLSQAVAELTLGMILSALRTIPFQCRQVCNGIWQKGMGGLLQNKVVGVLGFGAIGQRVGELLKAFDANVLYYDPIPKNVSWAKAVSFHNLLASADILTIHASGSEQILGEKELNFLCKSGVIVVNTSRGGLISEKALYKALISGQVAYACLDVFDQEPYSGPMAKLENVILTPHIGSYAQETRNCMEELAVENLIQGLKNLRIRT